VRENRTERNETMNYQQIKNELHAAGRLVDGGQIAAADAKIRALVPKGMTRADLAANLTEAQIAALKKHARAARK
jgi:hypothetical protein